MFFWNPLKKWWPGLVREVQAICKEIGLPDAIDNEENIVKDAVKEAIALQHLTLLKREMKGEKLRLRLKETWGLFDCRANMVTRYGLDLVCRACSPKPASGQEKEQEQEQEQEEQIESQKHLESFSGYSEVWQHRCPCKDILTFLLRHQLGLY